MRRQVPSVVLWLIVVAAAGGMSFGMPLLWQLLGQGPITQPTVLRSVNFGADPIRAVGGSSDAKNLIAASGGTTSLYAEDYGKVAGSDLFISVDRQSPQCIKYSVAKNLFCKLIWDVDIASGKQPRWGVGGYSGSFIGDVAQNNEPIAIKTWVKSTLFMFFPNETEAIGAGGYFSSPGCSTMQYPESAVLLTSNDWNATFDKSRGMRWIKGTPVISPDLGIASLAFSPKQSLIATVGIDSTWAQQLRSPGVTTPLLNQAGIKVWRVATPFSLAWESSQPLGSNADWLRRGGRGIVDKGNFPAYCSFTGDGMTLVVGWCNSEYHIFGKLTPTFVRIDLHDAFLGDVLIRHDIPIRDVFALALVGHDHEDLVAVNNEGLWRRRLLTEDSWSKVDLPGVKDITVIKTTRDRRHLLIGDAHGNVHVIGWP